LNSHFKSSLFNQAETVAFKNHILLQVSYLSHLISTQYIFFSFLISSKASANLISQSEVEETNFFKYENISGVKIYFHITQVLDFVSLIDGFSKNLDTENTFLLSSLVSIIQYELTSLSIIGTVAITVDFFSLYDSTNCIAADFLLSIKSSQNRTKNGSSQIRFFTLKIASQSHFGYGCLTYTILAILFNHFTVFR